MGFIGILGIATLLGIAWLLSFHKKSINFRTILGGISLQVVFALIVLKENEWSFVGMGILGLLINTFMLRSEDKKLGGGWKSAAVILAGSLLLGFGFHFIGAWIPWLIGAVVLLLIINGIMRGHAGLQRYCGALFIILGITWLYVNNYNGHFIFASLSTHVAYFLSLSDYGAQFIFGNLALEDYFGPWKEKFPNAGTWPGFGFQFGFKVLPTIIFFGGFMGVMYYIGLMQIVIESLSKFMRWTIGTSGAETLSCSANIFVGQTEAPLLIKPFLDDMTKSELLTVMVGGFATIAGGVLAGYIAMGVPAGHLLAASVMAAPGALVIGKILYPEKEHSKTAGDVKMPNIKVGNNVIEAATNGITDGLKLAANVGAMLIGFIALIAVADLLLNLMDGWIDGRLLGGTYLKYESAGLTPAVGEYRGYFPGSLRTIFGTILSPVAFLMGVPWEDAPKVGNLVGIKLSLNEFVAYGTLTTYISQGVIGERALVIATYALCGFANFSSVGIQIGGISAIAPKRKSDLAKVGLKAMFGGAIVSMLTGTIAGLLL